MNNTNKFHQLTLKQIKEYFKPNKFSAAMLAKLKHFLSEFQDFSSFFKEIEGEFRGDPEYLYFLVNTSVPLEALCEDQFWYDKMIETGAVKYRYIPEKFFPLFNIDDVVEWQVLSSSYIYHIFSNNNLFQLCTSEFDVVGRAWANRLMEKLIVKQTLPKLIRQRYPQTEHFVKLFVKFQKLDDDEILDAYNSRIDIQTIVSKQKLSLDLVNRLGERDIIQLPEFFEHQTYSEEELISIIKLVRNEDKIHPYREYEIDVNWKTISRTQKLSNDFIFMFRNHVDWNEIISNQNLSVNLLNRFSSHFSLANYFAKNKYISEDNISLLFKRSYINHLMSNQSFDQSRLKSVILNYKIDEKREVPETRKVGSLQSVASQHLSFRNFLPLDNTESDSYFDVDTLTTDFGFDLLEMVQNDQLVGFSNKLKKFYPPKSDSVFWNFIWEWCTCSEDFINSILYVRSLDKNEWNLISQHQKLSFGFIMDHRHDLNFRIMLQSQEIHPSILDEIVPEIEIPNDWGLFLSKQYCSQKLLNLILNNFINQTENVLKTHKIKSKEKLKEIILSDPMKFSQLAYCTQQPFSNDQLDLFEEGYIFYNKCSPNIFEKGVAERILNSPLISDMNERTKFMIINGIEPIVYGADFFKTAILDSTESTFFHAFITDQMVDKNPEKYFGDYSEPFLHLVYLRRKHSQNFIKKYFKFLSARDIVRNYTLDEAFYNTFFSYNFFKKSLFNK